MSINKNTINFKNEFTDFDDDDFKTTNNALFTLTVHLHLKKAKKGYTTIISGLNFETKEQSDTFLKNIKKKFGINGCFKINEEIDANEKVFIFSGDCREKVKEYMIKEMAIDEENVTIHG